MDGIYDEETVELQVKKLLEASQSIQTATQNNMEQALSKLFCAWKGEEAESFLKKAYSVNNEIKRLTQELCASCNKLSNEFYNKERK